MYDRRMIFGILGNTLTKLDLRLWLISRHQKMIKLHQPQKINTPSMAILNPAKYF
jgi:hypothetical protein